MSIHIGAQEGEIAETVLISGDPLRAKYVAENMLTDAVCYSSVRNMLGYTGKYNGKKVSVQGTGMGQSSLAIYVHELIHDYKVKNIIRIGTCGALKTDIKVGEIIIAQGASTDANFNKILFKGLDFAPMADFKLLISSYEKACKMGIDVRVGNVFSTDLFYFKNDPDRWKIWIEHKVLCTDMETSMLYTLAAGTDVKALSILTVSDNIITGEMSSIEDREKRFREMVKIALNIL
ncbi:MAG TPA: purine-nucleoside phosphorylase [Fulvivirga sp.]|nr:purine-nucleoside phosphorylase [Fulvivirga sp.]